VVGYAADMPLSIERFVLGDFATNCFVVWDDQDPARACWIVDCSYAPGRMLDFVESRGLKPSLCILTATATTSPGSPPCGCGSGR
jgi:glyoxylase-like metal-dependent hydrolase (beta-lactamase superfamily II)